MHLDLFMGFRNKSLIIIALWSWRRMAVIILFLSNKEGKILVPRILSRSKRETCREPLMSVFHFVISCMITGYFKYSLFHFVVFSSMTKSTLLKPNSGNLKKKAQIATFLIHRSWVLWKATQIFWPAKLNTITSAVNIRNALN